MERILGVDEASFNVQMEAINYPNPFSNTTTITFTATEIAPITVDLFDVLGRNVKSLKINEVVFGKNTFQLDLSQHESGIYFCKIASNELERTLKLLKN